MKRKQITLEKSLPYIFIIAGLFGCIASFALTYDKIHVLQNPNYLPACNINPILSCGSVMKTQQASVFGVPNTVFGLIAFTMLGTFGIVLAAGAQVRKWLWQAAELPAVSGLVFMHYLFYEAVFRINAICPWCFGVWMITTPVFWYLTLYNLRQGNIPCNRRFSNFLQSNHGNILLLWYLLIFGIILQHFWYYWTTIV